MSDKRLIRLVVSGKEFMVEPTGRVIDESFEIFIDGRTDWIRIASVEPAYLRHVPKKEVAREEERRGILRLSPEKLQDCRDEHLAWLTKRVWSRLPARDRQVLAELVDSISDDRDRDSEFLTFRFIGDFEAGNTLRPVTHHLSVARAHTVESDAAKMFVIALEFAHVVLRHPQPAVTFFRIAERQGFEQHQMGMVARENWMISNATLQVWNWGFESEFETFLQVCPEGYQPPLWYTELRLKAA